MPRNQKVEIWQLEDANQCHNVKTGKAVPFYVYEYSDSRADYPPGVVKRRDGKRATLEELVHLCDHDAESINAHDFCGAHRLLGEVLYRNLGRAKATKIMLDIAERRGLHGMSGVCGTADSFKQLGVGECGRDWDGNYGA
jgi:hypothetical protein